MTTHPARAEMERALREIFVPAIRAMGFKGTFPHFRRPASDQIQLITIQYFSSGGSFVVELAACGIEGFTHSWGKHVPPNKVTAHDIGFRHRLGSSGGGDHWFVFGKPNYEAGHDRLEAKEHYDAVASSVLERFNAEAQTYWQAPNNSFKPNPLGGSS